MERKESGSLAPEESPAAKIEGRRRTIALGADDARGLAASISYPPLSLSDTTVLASSRSGAGGGTGALPTWEVRKEYRWHNLCERGVFANGGRSTRLEPFPTEAAWASSAGIFLSLKIDGADFSGRFVRIPVADPRIITLDCGEGWSVDSCGGRNTARSSAGRHGRRSPEHDHEAFCRASPRAGFAGRGPVGDLDSIAWAQPRELG